MPLYEYQCTECGERFEVIQKFSDEPLKTCRKCKGEVERLISSPAIQFKGSGWYITDYARKGATPQDSSSGGSQDGAGSKTDTAKDKSKSKPETVKGDSSKKDKSA